MKNFLLKNRIQGMQPYFSGFWFSQNAWTYSMLIFSYLWLLRSLNNTNLLGPGFRQFHISNDLLKLSLNLQHFFVKFKFALFTSENSSISYPELIKQR